MITTLSGKNAYAIDSEKSKIIHEHLDAYGDLSLELFSSDIEDIRQVHAALSTVPFLVEQTLVVLNRPSEHKELSAKLPSWLEQKNTTTNVLIVEPTLDKRSSWAKYLQKETTFVEFKPLDEQQLYSWVRDQARQREVTISADAVRLLIRFCGPDQLRLSSELDKLKMHSRDVDVADVELLVEPSLEETVFHLLETLFSGQTGQVFAILEELELRGTDPHEVIAMIGWQLTTLAQIVVRRDQSPQSIAKVSGLHPYVVQKNMSIARKLDRRTVRDLLDQTVQAELRIKRDGEKAERVVQLLIFQISEVLKNRS